MQITITSANANNIVCNVTPPAQQVITIDRGVAGNGIVSIVPVTISTFQYLRITYTDGTVSDVGPLTSTAYTATAPINITGNTISLQTVPVANGGTGLTALTANSILYAATTNTIGQSANLTFDGSQLDVPAGAAATPAISTSSDSNTGFYFPAADNLGFSTGGAERMRIGSAGQTTITGNAIINSNTASDALRITQTGTGNALVVEDSANPDATPTVVDSAGNIFVAYGTSLAPSAVSGSNLQVNSLGSTQAAITASQWSAVGSGSAQILLTRSISGTVGSQTAVISGVALGKIRSFGSDGTNFIEAAAIESFVDGTPGTNNMPGRLVFSTTADGASFSTERMRIRADGVVQIGANAGATVNLKAGATGTSGAINWTFNTDSTIYGSLSLPYDTRTTVGLNLASTSSYPLTIQSGSTSSAGNAILFNTSGTERARITSVGAWSFGSTGTNTGTAGQVLTSQGSGAAPTWAAAAAGITVTNDVATATDIYPLLGTITTGTLTAVNTSNNNLLYRPSTGELKADVMNAMNGIFVNSATISTNYTIASGSNAMSAGPVTVASGITVTVSSGSVWTVV